MFLEIITPVKKIFSGEVNLVQLPGSKSSFEILKNHAHIISNLKKGTVRLINAEGLERSVPINGGIMECRNNRIIILTKEY
jgi:F-type H+-transporting ATPase subunit epsilon